MRSVYFMMFFFLSLCFSFLFANTNTTCVLFLESSYNFFLDFLSFCSLFFLFSCLRLSRKTEAKHLEDEAKVMGFHSDMVQERVRFFCVGNRNFSPIRLISKKNK